MAYYITFVWLRVVFRHLKQVREQHEQNSWVVFLGLKHKGLCLSLPKLLAKYTRK